MYKIGKFSVLAMVLAPLFAGAAFAQSAPSAKLFFEGDMVRGRTAEGMTGPVCVLTSQFKRLEPVVWRVRVLDAAGKPADDKVLKSLVVELPSGEKVAMKYGGHPGGNAPKTDFFWAGSWQIPATYPTGSLTYKVVATDAQGQTQTWSPFNIAPSQLTVVAGDVTFTK